jgi:hypothetical protein
MFDKPVNVCEPVADVTGVAVQEQDGRQFGQYFRRNSRTFDEKHVDPGGIL